MYECNSSDDFYWQYNIDSETLSLVFYKREEGYSKSFNFKSVNFTATITQVNITTTSVFTFYASRELHGGTVSCAMEHKHFYIYGKH